MSLAMPANTAGADAHEIVRRREPGDASRITRQRSRLRRCMPPRPVVFRVMKYVSTPRGSPSPASRARTVPRTGGCRYPFPMRILGIESSCDETAASVVEDGTRVRSSVISSSRLAFVHLAGVVPEEAARRQIEYVVPVVEKALTEAGITHTDLDAIAVTRGPGLLGSLLVGTTTARILAAAWNLPLIGVHHTLGHLCSAWLDGGGAPVFPVVTLSASGGHTDLWLRQSALRGRLLGRTRDDAAGEAFDKGASLLGLPYPGGPSLSKAAEGGDASSVTFPRPLHGETGCDFSFSGLKTALKYHLRDIGKDAASLSPSERADIAAAFQDAICTHLLDRLSRALDAHPDAAEVHIVGGVSANTRLRERAARLCQERGILLRIPPFAYCTDNAAMIACAGSFLLSERPDRATETFETRASLPLEDVLA